MSRAAARTGGVVLFGVGFGWVEAAVVVYLRRIFYPDGFGFPLRALDPALALVEIAREAATLLMLVAVACLAGRSRWERLGQFLVAFGVWDLVYYAGLRVALGWPAAWTDPDVLFLLPRPWVAPVYAPVSVAAMMVVAGAATASQAASGRALRAGGDVWALALAGVGLLLWSFLGDADAALGRAGPRPYPIAALLLGDALLAGAAWRFLRRPRSRAEEEGDAS